MKKKNIAIFLLVLTFFNFFAPFIQTIAVVNTDYYNMDIESDGFEGSIDSSSILLRWTGEIVYTLAFGIETLGANIVKAFTGKEFFPWADKIIFNAIPILDINFINPAPGSLMKDVSGNETTIGKILRNIYFTSLSIAIGFLSIVIAISGIRLAVASIAADKAKYKEAIVHWLICLVLIFGLHYLLSFTFYLYEKLVQAASNIANDALSTASDSVVNNLKLQADEDNEAIVESFLARCEKEALVESIPIIGDVIGFAKELISSIGKALSAAWKWITGQEDSTEESISVKQLNTMYPEKADYLNYFRDKSNEEVHKMRIDVAAYLLKDEYYRANYLQWISGNDTNDITNSGLAGVGRNILITCNDCLGIVDTGYKALRSLFTSVALITYQGSEEGKPFNSVAEAVDTSNLEEGADTSELEKQKQITQLDKENGYLYTIINSTEDYNTVIDTCNEEITKAKEDLNKEGADKSALNSIIFARTMEKLYAAAYYEYVYEGDDKYIPKASDTISSLGDYFKSSSWYVDTANGDWAPTSMNVVSAVCYGVFIIQSLMLLFAYFKRFFYVVILSLIGPVVVIFDYMGKSI